MFLYLLSMYQIAQSHSAQVSSKKSKGHVSTHLVKKLCEEAVSEIAVLSSMASKAYL